MRSELVTWSRQVLPVADELLSSYLIRVATAHCADPYRFLVHSLGPVPIWSRDIDRTAPDRLFAAVAQAGGPPPAVLARMTLVAWERCLKGRASTTRWTTGPWINAVGVYHRVRRGNGLQACLECLAENGAYLRRWRLSFVTVCERHQRVLIDACPRCEAPLVPHRQLAREPRCHACHRSFASTAEATRPIAPVEVPKSQAWLLESVLASASTQLGGVSIPLTDLVRGMAVLCNVGLMPRDKCEAASRGRIEHQRQSGRERRFEQLHSLVHNLPGSLRELAAGAGVSRPRFDSLTPPAWLQPLAEFLPPARAPRASRARQPTLKARLRTLEVKQPAGWRTTRASLLVKAALKR